MNSTGKRIIQKVLAILIVLTMFMADLCFAGASVITYAADLVEINNQNVGFNVYFVNQKTLETTATTDEKDLKLAIELSVKNDGYLTNGKIELEEESNFKFKKDISDSHIKKIEDRTIYLNQINEQDTVPMEIGIEFVGSQEIDENYLSKTSTIKLLGNYINSKNVDKNNSEQIEGKADLKINWKSPNKLESVLKAELLTNSIYSVNGVNKRVVQLLVSSKLANNSYPVKNTNIEFSIPADAESATVVERTTKATNGDRGLIYNYAGEENKLTVKIENGKDNKISWIKNAEDEFVVTLEYPENAELENKQVTVDSSLITYDNKELKQNAMVILDKEADGVITGKEIENQSSIGKGKLYTGEEKIYTTTSNIYINYAKTAKDLNIEEEKSVFLAGNEEKEAKIELVQTLIDKAKFTEIFGEDGTINIKDQNGNIVTTVDENGKIIAKYDKGTTGIVVTTSKPQKEGTLSLVNTKKILDAGFSREDIQELTKIKDSVKVDERNYSATVALKETESKASLIVEPATLTTSAKQQLNIKVVLETNNENRDLYKNPVLKIRLPKQINKISAEYDLLYGNGLKIDSHKIQEEDGHEVIIVNLKGEQKTYEGEAVKGATLLVKATVELNKLATNSAEEIVLNYENENATIYTDKGEEKAKVDIVAQSKMIVTNDIGEYGVTTIGNEGNKEVDLSANTEAKESTVIMRIANNEEADISNVVLLGKIANIDGKLVRTSAIRTNAKNAKIYYTAVENPTSDLSNSQNRWTEQNVANAKNFLVVIPVMNNGESIRVSYDLQAEKDLPYNLSTEAGYSVSYNNNLTGKQENNIKSTTLILTTGKTAEFKSLLTAKVGGNELKDGEEVKVGEIIEYTATVSNIGKEKAENVEITNTIPEDTVLIEVNPEYLKDMGVMDGDTDVQPYFIEKAEKELKRTVTIEPGKTASIKYMVKVNLDLSESKEVKSNLSVKYKNKEVESQQITNKLNKASLEINVVPLRRDGKAAITSGYNYAYKVLVNNLTNKEQKDVEVIINTNELVEVKNIDSTESTQSVKIDSIPANSVVAVSVDTFVKEPTNKVKTAELLAIAKDSAGDTYKSNKLIETITGVNAEVTLNASTTSKNDSGYVYPGDEIKYTIKVKNTGTIDADDLTIEDKFSDYLDLQSIKLNGEKCEYTENKEFGEGVTYNTLIVKSPLKVGEEATLEITGKVNEKLLTQEVLKIVNKAIINNNVIVAETDEKVYYIESAAQEEVVDDNNNDNTNNNNTGDNIENNTNTNSSTNNNNNGNNQNANNDNSPRFVISGTAWKDIDQNGSRDSGEELLEGIKVYAIDVSTNKIVTDGNGREINATTDAEGFYTLINLPEGRYIVAFEYDTDKYMVTAYKAEGVSSDKNSDAVKATREVNGQSKTLAVTDSINLKNSIANIDLGLADAKIFSLELQKSISKMVVTNNDGTKTYDFEDTNLAKVEIASKYLNSSNVVIEYKIKVTNNGEIAGYAKSIVDYIPSSLTFNSSLNKDWYKQGDNIYTSSLANVKIEPGETKEVKLVLTKKMTESNTGLTNNKAEIISSYNNLGVANSSTSMSANGSETNNSKVNKGSADAVISVKTGAAISYVALTLTIIIAICGAAYLIYKELLVSRIKI